MTQDVFLQTEGIPNKVWNKKRGRIFVPDEQGHILINLQNLCYCIKISRYWSQWILADETEFKIKYSLRLSKELLEKHGFFMVSSTVIINLEQIFRISNREKAHVRLLNGKEFPLSIRKHRDLLETLKKVYN